LDGGDIFVEFSFDNCADSCVWILICPGSSFLDRPNFLLTRLNIVRDSVFGINNVCRGVSAPVAGSYKLLPVLL
jgi:hypothetical protein